MLDPSDVAAIAIAVIAGLAFVGNEVRSWFLPGQLSVSRVVAIPVWVAKKSWPAKIQLEAVRLWLPDDQHGLRHEATWNVTVRSPAQVTIQDAVITFHASKNGPPTFAAQLGNLYTSPQDLWSTHRHHEVPRDIRSLELKKVEGPINPVNLKFALVRIVADGRLCRSAPVETVLVAEQTTDEFAS